jgi:hypothetical protein
MAGQFGENKEFAKFLLLAKNDAGVAAALKNRDHASIDAFPGLSMDEKHVLKTIDWRQMKIDVPNDAVTNFHPNLNARICTEVVGPTFATKKCTWKDGGLNGPAGDL